MHLEHADAYVIALMIMFVVIIVKFRPTFEGVHSFVELANTKGGIILILWSTSMFFFLAGVRLMYWSVQVQLDHPADSVVAWLSAGFNWISGGAFGGAFGAMIATMKGEAIQPNVAQKVTEVTEKTVSGGETVKP
jgi:hypothetical protein